jgi:hypothetical protein
MSTSLSRKRSTNSTPGLPRDLRLQPCVSLRVLFPDLSLGKVQESCAVHILKKSSLPPAHAERCLSVKTHAPSALGGSRGERKIYETIVGRAIMIIAVYHTNTHAAFAVSAPRTRESCVLRGAGSFRSRDAVTGTRAATPEEAALIRVDLMPAHQDRCAAPLICV